MILPAPFRCRLDRAARAGRTMRLAALAAVLMAPAIVMAQPMPPITATPLLPPSSQPPMMVPPPDQAPQAAPAVPPVAPPAPRLTWVPQGLVQLQMLDKVNALHDTVTVKVGQATTFGTLTIQVQACDNHPADQPQDSAAFLTITDGRANAPQFSGWMLANNPSLSMLQHPVYDVRVVGCRA